MATGASLLALIDHSQSGIWKNQASFDPFNSYNFGKEALNLNCSGQNWNTYTQQGQQCRMHQWTADLPSEKIIAMTISAISTRPDFLNQDVNVFTYVGSRLCSNNRSIPNTSYTPTASATCNTIIGERSEEHTSELQSLISNSNAV